MVTELETGGNIWFEEGKPSDKWFTSCVDLIRSRFNPSSMEKYGIKGINVNKVTRIHNRFLWNWFEDKLEKMIDLSDQNYKKSLEYLFYGNDPNLKNEISRAMEEGFWTESEYKSIGMAHFIGLVNSVTSADLARINDFF